MLKPHCLLTAVSLCFLMLFLVGCETTQESESDPTSFQDYLSQGKKHLAKNNGKNAAQAFALALSLDETSAEAKFGHLLASTLLLPNLIDQVLDTISAITFENTPGEDTTKSAFSTDLPLGVGQPIHEYLWETTVNYVETSESFYADLTEASDLSFEQDRYVIELADIELLSFSGRFDSTDVRVIGAVHSLMRGLLNLILAHDLRFDYTAIVIPKSDPNATSADTLNMIIEILEGLLYSETHPTFFYLEPHYGVQYMQRAGIDLGNTFARLAQAFSLLVFENHNQKNDPFRFIDTDGDGRYNPTTEPVLVGDSLLLDPIWVEVVRVMSEDLAAIFYEGTDLDADPDHTDLLSLALLNELLQALEVLPFDLGPWTIEAFPGKAGINLGAFFGDPSPDGVRNLLIALTKLLNSLVESTTDA